MLVLVCLMFGEVEEKRYFFVFLKCDLVLMVEIDLCLFNVLKNLELG